MYITWQNNVHSYFETIFESSKHRIHFVRVSLKISQKQIFNVFIDKKKITLNIKKIIDCTRTYLNSNIMTFKNKTKVSKCNMVQLLVG